VEQAVSVSPLTLQDKTGAHENGGRAGVYRIFAVANNWNIFDIVEDLKDEL
jgi:hypothetical protein